MASLPRPEAHDAPTMMRDLRWSHSEKAIARKAFELALQREFDLEHFARWCIVAMASLRAQDDGATLFG